MNPVHRAFTTSALPRRRWLLDILLGVLLPLYAFGWLAEAIRNRGGLDWDPPAPVTRAHRIPNSLSLPRLVRPMA